MDTRICESADCQKAFDPITARQRFCSHTCGSRENMRRMRARRRHRNSGPPSSPGGGPPSGGMHATLGNAVEYLPDGTVSDRDFSRYSVKSATRKPSQPVSDLTTPGAYSNAA